MKKIVLCGLLGIIGYMPGIYAAKYTITVINKTGATLDATMSFLPVKCGQKTVTINTGENTIGVDCCYSPVKFKVKEGPYAGKTANGLPADYPRVFHTCLNNTFTVEIKNGELTVTRK